MSSGQPPVLRFDDVWFGYPPLGRSMPVVEAVNLTVEDRDFIGVIGPNGGGKTTLLKLALGLLKPQSGRVEVLGRSPVRAREEVGYVPQHAQIDLSVPASVLDIVLMGRLIQSSWGAWFGARHRTAAMDALERVKAAELAGRTLSSLSGGQRQRVLIARALVSRPKLLLLDEPTAGIDAHMEESLTDLLHELNHDLAIVMVSHDVSFVSTHLKRVACMNRRIAVHRPDEIGHDVISTMYHGELLSIDHNSDCPLADPGCHEGCAPPPPPPPEVPPEAKPSEALHSLGEVGAKEGPPAGGPAKLQRSREAPEAHAASPNIQAVGRPDSTQPDAAKSSAAASERSPDIHPQQPRSTSPSSDHPQAGAGR